MEDKLYVGYIVHIDLTKEQAQRLQSLCASELVHKIKNVLGSVPWGPPLPAARARAQALGGVRGVGEVW